MAIRKVAKGTLPSVVEFDISDIEATEELQEMETPTAGLKAEKMSRTYVDSYQDAYKYGRPVRLPKGQLVELLQVTDENGIHPFKLKRPKDYVEPATTPCLVISCHARLPVPFVTLEQQERLTELGMDADEWLKNEKRRIVKAHMEAFHPSESEAFFPKEN